MYHKTILGREGHPVQSKQELGRDKGAQGQEKKKKKAGASLHTLRVPDWNRPMKLSLIALAITMTTGYNINHSAHCRLFDFSV